MDLHIATQESYGVLTVRVAGRLGFVAVGELRRACQNAPRLRLDLSELLSADETATNLLAALRDEGAEIVGVPPYIDLLLRTRHGRAP